MVIVRPELYVVKDVNGNNVPLEESDWENYTQEKGIYSILQKYQWPMNTVSDIKPAERREVFASTPDAERNFIEKKIRENFPNKNYTVVFIPTVVYELFAILMMHEQPCGSWNTISKKLFETNAFNDFFNEKKNYKFETGKVNELLYLAFKIGENVGDFPGFYEYSIDVKIRAAINNKEGKRKRKDIVAEIYALYTNINNQDVTKKVHFLLNWYISDQMIKNKNKNFKEIAGDVITRIDALLFKGKESEIKRNSIKSVAELIAVRIKKADTTCLDLAILQKNEIEKKGLKIDGVVARTIDLEQLAREKNHALLFRGTGVFEKLGGFEEIESEKPMQTKKTMHIVSSLQPVSSAKEPQSFGEIVEAYKGEHFKPFSISFGGSLFAGFFSDSGATVYAFMQKEDMYGYALTMDKMGYYLTGLLHINDLFFIPPLNTLSSLFACHEFFHPRGKACIPGDPLKYNKKVEGFSWMVNFPDYSGLFLIQRDPLKHEKLFSKYVADNAVILKVGDAKKLLPVEQETFKKVQKESAGFYGAIATMKQLSEKGKKRVRLLKKVKDLKYKKYSNTVYQGRENLLGFNEESAFFGDRSYFDLSQKYNNNITVQDKFCSVENPTAKALNSFRIMSFNVHNFHKICPDEKVLKKNPDYACETINKFSPDIALLQEIVPYVKTLKEAVNHKTQGEIDVDFSYFDKKMTDQGFVENVKINDFEYTRPGVFMGKAIFTKSNVKILDCDNNVLNPDACNRGYLRILFTYPHSDEKILLYTIHLSYGFPEYTKKEIETLMAFIGRDTRKFKTKNVIVMGDFNNSPYANSDIFSELIKNKFTLLNDPTPSTFAQNHAGIVIDLAWVSPDFLKKFEIKNSVSKNEKGEKQGYKLAVKANSSDHWPIYIDFARKKEKDPLSNSLSLLKAKLLQLVKSLKKK